jgi:hypothetical protein
MGMTTLASAFAFIPSLELLSVNAKTVTAYFPGVVPVLGVCPFAVVATVTVTFSGALELTTWAFSGSLVVTEQLAFGALVLQEK